ncbi:hypothetical protein [Sulfodiicoccus acidiphilus]|uniref:hypothetical protein n=1 Tax=Sulfodiicoccus acidiphilus TaxID=1670455 RepID=UPI000F829346|nr:hypothetical protein [Sulfodiicoccus acidiphilus]
MSPMLGTPSDLVTSADRCNNNYTACRFFTQKVVEGLELHMNQSEEVKFYSGVNIIVPGITSECSFFVKARSERGTVAHCKIMERVITATQAQLCSTSWQTCPLRTYFNQFQA